MLVCVRAVYGFLSSLIWRTRRPHTHRFCRAPLQLTNTLNDPAAFITKPYLAETLQRLLWGHNEKTGDPNPVGRPGQETEQGKAIRWAVRRLQRSYEFKKQSLVHAGAWVGRGWWRWCV